MPYADYYTVATRWVDIARNGERTGFRQYKNERMPIEGDQIFSYGRHFEIARALRDKKGKLELFLINGDRWGPTTSKHQSHVRAAIQRSEVPSVIIPYQALHAAGVEGTSVRVLDRSGDRIERKQHVVHEQPPGSLWRLNEVWEHREPTEADLQALVDRRNAKAQQEWEDRMGWVAEEQDPDGFWHRMMATRQPPVPVTVADLTEYDKHPIRYLAGHQRVLYQGRSKWRTIDVEQLPDGRTEYRWETTRHWLGESLISAEVSYRLRKFCKVCNGRGRGHDPDGHWEWRGYDEPSVSWARPADCEACRGRGTWFEARTRRTKFLSGFDANESRPSYFFCELPPKCPATTIAAAYEALKPDAVRLAEQMGREVKRQGDIFAVPIATVDKRSLRKAGATFTKRGQLFGTNHVATEVAYLPDGNTLVRGVITHAPAFRRPDHARVRLDDGWYVVCKNLVPTAA